MPEGYFTLVLHAHLPFVRHPEHETFLEEQWLFEAVIETYVPLLRMCERLEEDGADYAFAISLSPTLVAMLEDELLQERTARHLRQLIDLADREVDRTTDQPKLQTLARYYAAHFRDILYWYEERYGRRLTAAFRNLASFGRLELLTCAATHGFLPLLKVNPGAVRAQIFTAVEEHARVFGVRPAGLWIPECAYYPGLDAVLREAGVRYFFLDAHGLENATEAPRFGLHAPVYTQEGVAVFARDKETSHQVWAAEVGYPGQPEYREFYRDVGFDLEAEAVKDFLIDGRIRTNTGIKYYRITGRGEEKDLYDLDRARELAARHADDFLHNRQVQAEHLGGEMARPPLVVSPYDAELFGHWWYEGPLFLDYLFRKMCYDQTTIRPITPSAYLAAFPENQVTTPAASSWGGEGTYEFWLNPTNDAIYRDLHAAGRRMAELVDRPEPHSDDEKRLLAQMGRELLLAQASDWPFIMRTGTSPEYAGTRVRTHLARFWSLEEMLRNRHLDERTMTAIEFADDIFPTIRPEWFGRRSVAPIVAT